MMLLRMIEMNGGQLRISLCLVILMSGETPLFGVEPILVQDSVAKQPDIVYVDSQSHAFGSIVILHFQTRSTIKLMESESDVWPRWSPDRSWIAFARESTAGKIGGRQPDIYIVKTDGQGVRRLTEDPHGSTYPVWSPDGKKIAFHTQRDGHCEIFMYDIEAGKESRVTKSSGTNERPSWSPDSRKIAFVSTRDGNAEIYVAGLDAEDPINITRESAMDAYPSWSPSGDVIAFASNRTGDEEIFVTDATGSNAENLTQSPGRDYAPRWSRDGKRIAFQSERDGNVEIYMMEADGTDPVNLTKHDRQDWNPIWSPDGRWMLFHSNRDHVGDSDWDIYLLDMESGKIERITQGCGGPFDW